MKSELIIVLSAIKSLITHLNKRLTASIALMPKTVSTAKVYKCSPTLICLCQVLISTVMEIDTLHACLNLRLCALACIGHRLSKL